MIFDVTVPGRTVPRATALQQRRRVAPRVNGRIAGIHGRAIAPAPAVLITPLRLQR